MAAAVVTNRRGDSLKPDILEGARKELLAHCVRLTKGHDNRAREALRRILASSGVNGPEDL